MNRNDIVHQMHVFVTDLVKVYEKHGMSLSHEYREGAFIIEPYKKTNVDWLKQSVELSDEVSERLEWAKDILEKFFKDDTKSLESVLEADSYKVVLYAEIIQKMVDDGKLKL